MIEIITGRSALQIRPNPYQRRNAAKAIARNRKHHKAKRFIFTAIDAERLASVSGAWA